MSSRSRAIHHIQDTIGILPNASGEDSIVVQRIPEWDTSSTKYDPDIIGVEAPEEGWAPLIVTDTVVFGYDTVFDHRRLDLTFIDSVDTNYRYQLVIGYETLAMQNHSYYKYLPGLAGLPDVSAYGLAV